MNGYGRGEDKQDQSGGSVVTRETFGMTLLFFSVILVVFSLVGPYIMGDIGKAITSFLYGTLGFFLYPFFALCIYGSLVLIAGKKFVSGKNVLRVTALTVSVFLIAHLATSLRFSGNGFGSYMQGCWTAAGESALRSTAGGVLLGVIVYPALTALTLPGAYVVFSLLATASLVFFLFGTPARSFFVHSRPPKDKSRSKEIKAEEPKREEPLPQPKRADEYAENSYPNYTKNERTNLRPPLDDRLDYGREKSGFYYEEQNYPPRPTDDVYREPPQTNDFYPRGEQRPLRPVRNFEPRREQTPPPRTPWTYVPPRPRENSDLLYPAKEEREDKPTENRIPTAKELLYSKDPGRDYWSNLAYNGDGYFNNRIRKSSVRPVSNEFENYPTYSEEYHAQAEQPQRYVTRQVVEQRPMERNDGYSIRTEDLNYSHIPDYKQAEKPVEEEPKKPEVPEKREELFRPEEKREEFTRDRDELFRPEEKREEFTRDRDELFRPEEKREEFTRDRDELFRPEEKREEFTRDRDELFRPEEKREEFTRDRDELFRPEEKREEFTRDRDELFRPEEKREEFSRDRDEILPREEPSQDRTFERAREIPQEPAESSFPRDELFEVNEPEEDSYRFGEERMPNLFTDGEEEYPEETEDLFPEEPREYERSREFDRAEQPFEERQPLEQEEEQFVSEPSRAMSGMSRTQSDIFESDDVEPVSYQSETPYVEPKKKHVYRPYQKPSLSLLKKYDDKITVSQEEIDRNSAIIVDTLSGFRVDAEVTKVTPGPAVTRYDIDIPRNISVNTVTKRSGEIAMRLHARDGVNMYANNETGTISIEVPNAVRATVGLSSVMQSEEYLADKPGSLLFAIGKDIEGRNVCGDIPKMTHILVAGTTNAGKSVALNAMLVSLVCKYSPEELRLILVDPKRTEFIVYDGLPHLMINEIIGDAQKAIMALNWSIKEMERRYALFEQKTRSGVAVRNVDEYNMNLTEDEEKLPKIVFVVDELADLMSVAKKDIEERIQRLTQKARAAGIHLVLATQRPSVDVITGVIKGNLPTRMAVRVIQEVDSRTILDESGAEKLLGMGDMLFKTGGMFNCKRVQGAFISTPELQAIMEDIKQNNESYFDPEVSDYINRTEEVGGDDEEDRDGGTVQRKSGDADPLYIKALSMVVKLGSASISLIQRRCGVGYNHAGKIMEWMEEKGYVSPFDGKAKARTVLLTKEEFESLYGPLD